MTALSLRLRLPSALDSIRVGRGIPPHPRHRRRRRHGPLDGHRPHLQSQSTFSVVEYLSHRFSKGGKGTTMDSKADFDPVAAGKAAGGGPRTPTQGGHA